MQKNVRCLKRLQGLRAIANSCQKLKGLNIIQISVDDIGSSIQLWELLLVALQLTYLSIDLCCLLCYVIINKPSRSLLVYIRSDESTGSALYCKLSCVFQ